MSTQFYVTAGLKEDCAKVISLFEQAEDLRFQTFCKIWKDLKFSLIFKGRYKVAELMEFCEEALNISKQYLFAATFKERICGLYLLYGIYYKMPFTQFKIRVKLADWKSIVELHNQIREGEHLDANYILSKLIVENAFHHCLFDHEYLFDKGYKEKSNQSVNPYSVLPSIKNMTEQNQLLSKINVLSNIYHQSKCEASTSNPKKYNLTLYNHNFIDDIKNDIKSLEEARQIEQSNAAKKIAKRVPKAIQGTVKKSKQPPKDSHNVPSGQTENNESQINISSSDDDSSPNE